MVRVGIRKHAVWAISDACRSVSNQPCSIRDRRQSARIQRVRGCRSISRQSAHKVQRARSRLDQRRQQSLRSDRHPTRSRPRSPGVRTAVGPSERRPPTHLADQLRRALHGNEFHQFDASRIDTRHGHGAGDTLAATINAAPAHGYPVPEAVGYAMPGVTECIHAAIRSARATAQSTALPNCGAEPNRVRLMRGPQIFRTEGRPAICSKITI
jgi:Phosphomethylpyrimidine kinase